MTTSNNQTMDRWKFSLRSIGELMRLAEELNCPIEAIEDTSVLAEPVEIGHLHSPNSLAVHPMEGCDGDNDGKPGKLTLRRYRRFAAGGAGLIWAEAIAIAGEARANPRQLWLHDGSKTAIGEMVSMMRRVAAESMGPDHKPVIVAQLTHSGRYSKPQGKSEPLIPQRDPYRDVLAPEPVPSTTRDKKIAPDYPIVTDEYLDQLQGKYVEAARLAFEAGFDAVDIKSCHGYLINELLASRDRKGKYGGSFENRTRFVLEVIDKIHKELGADKTVCTRLGIYDAIPFPYGWGVDEKDYRKADLTEPKKLIALMIERGVKLVNVTIGNPYYNPHVGRPFSQTIKGGYPEPEHPLVGVNRIIGLAGEIQKEFPQIAVVGTGYSWLRQLMGNVAAASKANGKATFIGAGRMAFAYPDFAKDLLQNGKLDVSKVCVGCSACTQLMRDAQTSGCVVRDNKIYGPIFKHGRMSDPVNLKRLAQSCLQCQEPTCQHECPAGIDVPGFIKKFLDGDDKAAYEIIRESNVLPEVCAWLCPVESQCQGGCLQKFIGDDALPIAEIQRYLSEQANKNGWSKLRIPEKVTGKKIAVIGAGPASLSAAAILLEAGHNVTVFDKNEEPGGMVESVIPADRQSGALANELRAIFADVPSGRLEMQKGVELTEKFNLDSIMDQGFDACFIGIGLSESITTATKKLDGLYDALEFLGKAKLDGQLDVAGKKVAVIGGGNTAMDVAVTAAQLGAKDVYVIYRRSFTEMPAWAEERERAVDAGVHFIILTQQLDYLSDNGKVAGVKVCPCQLGDPDESGRRKPIAIKSSSYDLDFDIIAESIGQKSIDGLDKILGGVELKWGCIQTKPGTCQTTRPNTFAGGDIVRGASTVVAAVADGMKAAKEINGILG